MMSRGGNAGAAIGAVFREMELENWRSVDRVRIGALLENILEQDDFHDSHTHAQANDTLKRGGYSSIKRSHKIKTL